MADSDMVHARVTREIKDLIKLECIKQGRSESNLINYLIKKEYGLLNREVDTRGKRKK